MRKILARVTAFLLVLTLAGGVGFSTNVSLAKGNGNEKKEVTDPIEKISVRNSDDFEDMQIGSTQKIKVRIQFAKNVSKKTRKEAKDGLTYKSKKSSIAKVDKKGKVTAVAPGSTKITIKPGVKSKKSAELMVEVSSNLDMVFKYSNLYFIVPDGAPFPVSIEQGGQDANGSTFDILTKDFDGKLSDFIFTSENASIAAVDTETGTLKLNGYGTTEIEAEYKKESEVGDTVTVYVLTQAEFDQKKADGEIDEELANNFDEEPDEPDEPEDPKEPEEPDLDVSEDEE